MIINLVLLAGYSIEAAGKLTFRFFLDRFLRIRSTSGFQFI